jgi:hypothetical protein
MHFEDTDFVDDTQQKLKDDAVPIVHKYSHYFKVTGPEVASLSNKPETGTRVCLLCISLKKWNIKLKTTTDPIIRLFP